MEESFSVIHFFPSLLSDLGAWAILSGVSSVLLKAFTAAFTAPLLAVTTGELSTAFVLTLDSTLAFTSPFLADLIGLLSTLGFMVPALPGDASVRALVLPDVLMGDASALDILPDPLPDVRIGDLSARLLIVPVPEDLIGEASTLDLTGPLADLTGDLSTLALPLPGLLAVDLMGEASILALGDSIPDDFTGDLSNLDLPVLLPTDFMGDFSTFSANGPFIPPVGCDVTVVLTPGVTFGVPVLVEPAPGLDLEESTLTSETADLDLGISPLAFCWTFVLLFVSVPCPLFPVFAEFIRLCAAGAAAILFSLVHGFTLFPEIPPLALGLLEFKIGVTFGAGPSSSTLLPQSVSPTADLYNHMK